MSILRLQVTISAADLKERTKKILSREVTYEDRHSVRDFLGPFSPLLSRTDLAESRS